MSQEKTGAALATPDLLPVPKRRGRVPSGQALSSKERQAKFRKARASVALGERMTATVASLAEQFDMTQSDVTAALVRFALCNRNWRKTGF